MDNQGRSTLSNEEKKKLAQKKMSVEINPFEAEVIKKLRLFRNGKFTVVVLDGLPIRFVKEESNMFFEGISADELGIAASTSRNPYQR